MTDNKKEVLGGIGEASSGISHGMKSPSARKAIVPKPGRGMVLPLLGKMPVLQWLMIKPFSTFYFLYFYIHNL